MPSSYCDHTRLDPHRYIADRFLPDKAIDIMDEAGSRARITAYFSRASSGQGGAMDPIAWEELKQVMDAKDDAIKDGLFEEAMLLRSRENDLKARLAGPADEAPVIPVVTPRDIEAIVSAWTGVPVERMSEEDSSRLMRLDDVLRGRVIGQDDAVEAIARAMRRARSGLKDPDRPIATLMFSGPTGVGKTELTKVCCMSYVCGKEALKLSCGDNRDNRDNCNHHRRWRNTTLAAQTAWSAWTCPSTWSGTRLPSSSVPPRATWAMGRAASSPKRSGGVRLAWCCWMRSKRHIPTSLTSCCK